MARNLKALLAYIIPGKGVLVKSTDDVSLFLLTKLAPGKKTFTRSSKLSLHQPSVCYSRIIYVWINKKISGSRLGHISRLLIILLENVSYLAIYLSYYTHKTALMQSRKTWIRAESKWQKWNARLEERELDLGFEGSGDGRGQRRV